MNKDSLVSMPFWETAKNKNLILVFPFSHWRGVRVRCLESQQE